MKKIILLTAGLLLSSQMLFASTSEETKAMKFDEFIKEFKVEILESNAKKTPSIVFINKCGEIVGELYGSKKELSEKFQEMIEKGSLISTSSTMEVYVI
jgi:hypothetical protein